MCLCNNTRNGIICHFSLKFMHNINISYFYNFFISSYCKLKMQKIVINIIDIVIISYQFPRKTSYNFGTISMSERLVKII